MSSPIPSSSLPPTTICARRTAAPVAIFGPPSKLELSGLDAQRCAAYLRTFPSKFRSWGEAEWRQFGLSPLTFSTQPIDGGVALVYYLSEAQARAKGLGGLVEDGGRFELQVQVGGGGPFGSGPGIAIRSKQGSVDRSRQEAVIVARLADECGAGKPFGTLASRWRPPKRTLTTLNAIACACKYDKIVRKRY